MRHRHRESSNIKMKQEEEELKREKATCNVYKRQNCPQWRQMYKGNTFNIKTEQAHVSFDVK